MKKPAAILSILLVASALAACSSAPEKPDADSASWLPDVAQWLTPYRINLRQGNLVTPEMLRQIKPGLTQEQVRFLLGTPLLTDIFHANRWDYIYRFQPGGGAVEQRRLSFFFKDGKLERYEGNALTDKNPVEESADKAATRVIEIKAAPASPAEPAADKPAEPGK